MRYMITGNVLQACGVLGKYKGQIVSFTRKDKETGEITNERGMLLAENFDPENFQVRTAVTKEDVWGDNAYKQINDDLSKITVYRNGSVLQVFFEKKDGMRSLSNHPIKKDDAFAALTKDKEGVFSYDKFRLAAVIPEENVEEALNHLYEQYGFTKSNLLVMPDSTDKPDAIVYTDRPYQEVIDDFGKKYGVGSLYGAQRVIKNKLKRYRMDINNEALKNEIRELVQLRQAYLRKQFSNEEDSRLAWESIIQDEAIDRYAEYKDLREDAYNKREAIIEEMQARGLHGTPLHLTQGEMTMQDVKDLFDDLNEDKENEKLFDKVYDKMKDMRMNAALNEKMHNSVGGQAGGKVLEYNWKYMNSGNITDYMKSSTILHEMIHTTTVYAFDAVKNDMDHLLNDEVVDAVNELNNIYNEIKNADVFTHTNGEVGYTMYGTQDVYEMMSEAGSNKLFKEDLKKIKLSIRNKSGFITFTKVGKNDDTTGKKVVSAYDAITERLNLLVDNFSEKAWHDYYKGTELGEYQYSRKPGESLEEFGRRVNEMNKSKENRAKADKQRGFHIRKIRKGESLADYGRYVNDLYEAKRERDEEKQNEAINGLVEAANPKASAEEKAATKAAISQIVNNLGRENVVFESQEGAAERMNGETMAEVNSRFNEQLDLFDRGELTEPLNFGKPHGVLAAIGMPSDEDITMSLTDLRDHLDKHSLTIDDIRNLPSAISNPLMVYDWGTRNKSRIVITEIEKDGNKITVAVRLERGGSKLVVNEIASIHAKEASRFMLDMANAKEGGLKEALLYIKDKEKVLDWLGIAPPKGVSSLTNEELSVANVIENFENQYDITGEKDKYINDATTSGMSGEQYDTQKVGRANRPTTTMTTSDGQVYGWAEGNKIHITPNGINPNTPLHEYGHLYARVIEGGNPRLWSRIKELLATLPKELWDFVDENYKDLDENARYREVFARYFGNRGEERLKQDTAKLMNEGADWKSKGFVADLFGRIKQAIKEAKKWIAKSILKLDPKKIKNIDDVFDKTYYDFANGFDPNPDGNGPKGGKKITEAMVAPSPATSNFLRYVRDVLENPPRVDPAHQIAIDP